MGLCVKCRLKQNTIICKTQKHIFYSKLIIESVFNIESEIFHYFMKKTMSLSKKKKAEKLSGTSGK